MTNSCECEHPCVLHVLVLFHGVDLDVLDDINARTTSRVRIQWSLGAVVYHLKLRDGEGPEKNSCCILSSGGSYMRLFMQVIRMTAKQAVGPFDRVTVKQHEGFNESIFHVVGPSPSAMSWVHWPNCVTQMTEAGWDADLSQAILLLGFVIPYSCFFGAFGWFQIPGMNKWLSLIPIIGAGLAIFISVHTIGWKRRPEDFGEYSGAIGALNGINLATLLLAFYSTIMAILAAFHVSVPKLKAGAFWRKRADANRNFVCYTMQRLSDGVHYAQPMPRQSMKVSFKDEGEAGFLWNCVPRGVCAACQEEERPAPHGAPTGWMCEW